MENTAKHAKRGKTCQLVERVRKIQNLLSIWTWLDKKTVSLLGLVRQVGFGSKRINDSFARCSALWQCCCNIEQSYSSKFLLFSNINLSKQTPPRAHEMFVPLLEWRQKFSLKIPYRRRSSSEISRWLVVSRFWIFRAQVTTNKRRCTVLCRGRLTRGIILVPRVLIPHPSRDEERETRLPASLVLCRCMIYCSSFFSAFNTTQIDFLVNVSEMLIGLWSGWIHFFACFLLTPLLLPVRFPEAICCSALWKSALKNVNRNGLKSAELTFRNKNITLIHCGILVISE